MNPCLRFAGAAQKCGFLKDTIINFGELLNQAIYTLGEQNCASADLCLGMGSSMRVQTLPEQCALNGGRFVIVNLQATPLDHLATLIIRAKCDDVMVMSLAVVMVSVLARAMHPELARALRDPCVPASWSQILVWMDFP